MIDIGDSKLSTVTFIGLAYFKLFWKICMKMKFEVAPKPYRSPYLSDKKVVIGHGLLL
jgi:hypothetical protein